MRAAIRADPGVRQSGAERGAVPRQAQGARREAQYSLAGILGLWALAAAPMGLLNWVAFPGLATAAGPDPLRVGVTRLALLALGLVWLFVLSLIVVRREEGDLRRATIKRRLRLNAPRDVATGEPRRRLWLWLVPFIVAVAAVELALSSSLERAWVSALPFLAEPAGYSAGAFFQSREVLARLA